MTFALLLTSIPRKEDPIWDFLLLTTMLLAAVSLSERSA